jgi:hypothetical protein
MMAQGEKDWVGFDCFVTREDRRTDKKGEKRKIIAIEPTDTKHTLKQKRNNGKKTSTHSNRHKDKLEWHHEPSFFSKNPGQQSAEGGCKGGGGGGGNGVYRKISDYKPTSNPNVINAYEQQLQQCALLCKIHHECTHTHTLVENSRLQQQQSVASRLATYTAVYAEHGPMAALLVLRALRKLD